MYGKRFFALALAFSIFAVGGCALESDGTTAIPDELLSQSLSAEQLTEFRFVKKVILGAEYGNDLTVARFTRPARVSIMGASDANQHDAVQFAANEINSALAQTFMRLNLVADNSNSADIYIYFAPVAELSRIARANGFEYIPGNSGLFWTFWNANHEINHSVILIASDLNLGSMLKSVVLEELTQSLGAGNDQDFVRESIFYETARDSGNATRLSPLDRKLLNFLYSNVPPGANPLRVESSLLRNW